MQKEEKNMNANDRYVVKRDNRKELINHDKIFYRIKKLIEDPKLGKLENISALMLSKEVDDYCVDGISTTELDNIAGSIAMGMRLTQHLEYEDLAIRITISNLHKNTSACFSDAMESLVNNVNSKGQVVPILNERFIKVVRDNKDILDKKIDPIRDYTFTKYIGLKTLEKSYLQKKFTGKSIDKIDEKGEHYTDEETIIAETPQFLLMRVAIGMYYKDIDSVLRCYDLMSNGYYTHASPTLFNAGTILGNLSSCFLINLDDSMDMIYKTLGDCALISKSAGGIGLSASKIRPKGSFIRGTNGKSSGIVPMLKNFNATAEYANQGGKRAGSFAIYLEPWHADIMDFLELRNPVGDEKRRARELFYALWVSDAFMEAVTQKKEWWYLMGENECPGLVETYGEEHTKLYWKYVEQGKYMKKIKVKDLWEKICISQIETGMPYISFKNAVNSKSNQQNLGTIVSSNLCNEINIYHDKDEYGTCNIATVSLPKYVEEDPSGKKFFNFQKLYEIVKDLVINMNMVIDNNVYPVPETKNSNLKHRPLALGSQGLSSAYFAMRLPFESSEARKLNKDIFETIQYAALESSCELAKKHGAYSSFQGSPASKGLFQHNLYGIDNKPESHSGLWDWDSLKEKVMKYGLRNSLLTSSPPTASTSQILGNYESFEPIHSNVFERELLSGNFTVINDSLIKDLIKLNIWNDSIYKKLLSNRGSIQNIPEIPNDIKELYKTVWEIRQMTLINYSLDRQLYTDQTQSLNLYVKEPTIAKLSSLHAYTWKKGLKTGMYYLRSQSKAKMESFTIQKENVIQVEEEPKLCYINDPGCASCSG